MLAEFQIQEEEIIFEVSCKCIDKSADHRLNSNTFIEKLRRFTITSVLFIHVCTLTLGV